jgi:hypothetical protein
MSLNPKKRFKRHSLGSARVSRAGDGVFAIANFIVGSAALND